MTVRSRGIACLLAMAVVLSPAWAQEEEKKEKELGWFDTAELGFVATSGNADSTTLGFNNLLRRVWQHSVLRIEIGAVLAESRSGDRFAVGDTGDFSVKEPPKTTDAERYFLKSLYAHTITERFFWNAGFDAEQNKPSGIEHRYTAFGGLGHLWYDRDDMRFATLYSVSWTDEDLTVEGGNDFAGYRLGYGYMNQLTKTTTFDSELTFDGNLDESNDWRFDFFNAITVNISENLALKASYRMLFRNQPPLESLTVYDSNPNQNPGAIPVGTVDVDRDDLDTVFTTSLVVTF